MKIYTYMGVGANEFHRDWGQMSFTEIVLHIRYLVGRELSTVKDLKNWKKNAFFFKQIKISIRSSQVFLVNG